MIYHLTKATGKYLEISNETEIVELVFISIFHLIADNEQTVIAGYKFNYKVDMHIDTLSLLMPQKRFLRVHDKYVVGRDHVGAFENNVVEILPMKFPVGEGYEVKKEDFPFVATPELVIQGAMKDRKINRRWELNSGQN
jgi:hypothetical protein